MKERPILFSAPMVTAILEDRKTMTRRVIKPQPTRSLPHTKPLAGGDGNWTIHHPLGWRWRPSTRNGWSAFVADGEGRSLSASIAKRCPYGVPGDRWRMLNHFGFLTTAPKLVPFTPCRGAQGFWRVPHDVLRRLAETSPRSTEAK
jgi:hypothetical protein